MQVRNFSVSRFGFGKRDTSAQTPLKLNEHLPVVQRTVVPKQEEIALARGLDVFLAGRREKKLGEPDGLSIRIKQGLFSANLNAAADSIELQAGKSSGSSQEAVADLARKLSGRKTTFWSSTQRKFSVQVPDLLELGKQALKKAPGK